MVSVPVSTTRWLTLGGVSCTFAPEVSRLEISLKARRNDFDCEGSCIDFNGRALSHDDTDRVPWSHGLPERDSESLNDSLWVTKI